MDSFYRQSHYWFWAFTPFVFFFFHPSANLAWSPVLYGFSLAYLFAPSTFSSANIIEFAAGQPEWVKFAEKTILAAPFAFHSLNGLRHLAWDTGKCLSYLHPCPRCDDADKFKVLTLKGAYRTGYVVLGATAVSTLALVLL